MSWEQVTDPRSLAPTSFAAWDSFVSQASGAVDPAVRALIRSRVAAMLGAEAAGAGEQPPVADDVRAACAEAVEQFVIDVSALTDAQRAAVTNALGEGAFTFFQTLYAYDMNVRLEHALTQLFGAAPAPLPAPAPGVDDLWPALDAFLNVVAAQDALDPVTTELVRLRGARAHNCRICQSRRNVTAIDDGADESTFDKIDFFETSDLDERAKVALRLTDAMVWTPAAYPAGLVEQVRGAFSPAEAVEIVLDVVRNAANKPAVAMQVDAPVVSSGVEYFRIEPDGTLSSGLDAPVGARA
jgi:alkylhydroperoxidase family enzyme